MRVSVRLTKITGSLSLCALKTLFPVWAGIENNKIKDFDKSKIKKIRNENILII